MPAKLPATTAECDGSVPLCFQLPDPLQWQGEGNVRIPAADEVHLWRIALDRGAVRVALAALVPAERERAAAFRFDNDRERYAIGRYALRCVLGRYLGLAPTTVPIALGLHGKPRLEGKPTLEFNLSHSGALALCAVAAHGRLGIDLEALRPQTDALDLARLSFSSAEQAALAELAPPLRDQAFLCCWTRKEAVLKAVGIGLLVDLEACHAGIGPAPIAVQFPASMAQPPLPVLSLCPDGAHVAGLSGDVLARPWSLRAMDFDPAWT